MPTSDAARLPPMLSHKASMEVLGTEAREHKFFPET